MFCKIYLLVHIHRVIQACVRKIHEVSSSISLSLALARCFAPSLAREVSNGYWCWSVT